MLQAGSSKSSVLWGVQARLQRGMGARSLGDAGARLEGRVEELQQKLAAAVQEAGLLEPGPENPLSSNPQGATWDPVKLRGPCVSYFDELGHMQVRSRSLPSSWSLLHFGAVNV